MVAVVRLPSCPFFASNGVDTAKCSGRKRWDCRLHTDFDRLKGAESHISNELSRSAGSEVQCCLVAVGHIFAS